ncbi:MAG: YggS family pyridoxal phosphate-dependent enzyme [Filifactoraceae bacterium]
MVSIYDNISSIKENIIKAQKVSMFNQEVTLIAVTKTVNYQKAIEALEAGVQVIGENRVQEVLNKYPNIPKGTRWHLIGSLQTNKVKYIIDKVELIHSLDRMDLAIEIDKRAKQHNKVMEVLVQVNISHENSKHGLLEMDVVEFIKNVASSCENVKIVGLMGMASFEAEKEETRPYFKKLSAIFQEIKGMDIPNVDMKHLSMGMSNDYEVAIEEGATLVRVGTSIFAK